MSKLQNIKAIREMVDGTHKMQTRTTIGYDKPSDNKVREVGEVWEEKNALGETVCWWEQMKGWKRKIHNRPDVNKALTDAQDYLRSFPNCQKEKCTCVAPTSLDLKFKKRTGMCEDCVMSLETQLKIQGKFDEYAKGKMRNNAEAFFADADKEVEKLKDDLTKPITFLEDKFGNVETWKSENSKALTDQIDNQYNTLKEKVREKLQ